MRLKEAAIQVERNKTKKRLDAACRHIVCLQPVLMCHSVLWYCARCFLSLVLLLDTQKGTMHFLRPCSFWLLYSNSHAFVFLVCSVHLIPSTVYWGREHRHDLHDVDVTSGHAFPNPSMVLSLHWCLEMAWGHSSWSSVNLSFLLPCCAAKCVSVGTAAK